MLSWKQPLQPAGTTFGSYSVEVATNSAFTNIVGSTSIADPAVLGWNVSPALGLGKTYYWQVQACNSGGVCGDWSKVWSFRTPSH